MTEPETIQPAAGGDLTLAGLQLRLGGRTIIEGIDLQVTGGRTIGLLGPNGCGKSTLLRSVYRALKPHAGMIRLGEDDLLTMPLSRSARHIAPVTQFDTTDLDFTVHEVVAMGRTPHSGGGRLSQREEDLCAATLADLEISHLRNRGILGLSGGERQRVIIARALVQEPELLVLDEPTNHLDPAHQVHLLRLLRRLDVNILVVLHDLNLAAAVCDVIHLMDNGRVIAHGTPREVITEESINMVFGVQPIIVDHPLTGAPQVLYDFDW